MADYLLDCNHLSAALRKASPLRARLRTAHGSDHRLITRFPVLCELDAGIQQTARVIDNRQRLTMLLNQVRLWPLDTETTHHFGTVHLELRRMGRVLSQVDMMLAALARQHRLTILTTDNDFQALRDLRIENWVV